LLIKEETKRAGLITQLHTDAESIILLSNIEALMKFDTAASFVKKHQSRNASSIRKAQLAASDMLLHELLPQATLERQGGRPMLLNAALKVSISHTGNHISMILGKETVAVDMEPIDRSVERIASKFVKASDMAIALEALPSNPALLVWCIKECLFKYACTEGVDFKDHLHLLQHSKPGCVDCEITHPQCNAYLRVRFTLFNQLLIAYIG